MESESRLPPIHVWSHCHACGMQPIVGRRFGCQTCPRGPDTDLCERCHDAWHLGLIRHPPSQHRMAHASTARHAFRLCEGQPAGHYLPWLEVPFAAAASPAIPQGFVVRPEFRSKNESCFGPYAFALRLKPGGPSLVLTALHVMDEFARSNGIDCSFANPAYSGRELPRLLTRAVFYDVFAPQWPLAELGTAGQMLVLPDARLGEEEPRAQRDLAAFLADPGAKLSPGRLAERPPPVGQSIWLAVPAKRGSPARTVAGVVVEQTDQTLIFRYAPGLDIPRGTSGAPLVDRAGHVVGINIGGGFVDGRGLGHACHVGSIRRLLPL